jgi:hypothetical protein
MNKLLMSRCPWKERYKEEIASSLVGMAFRCRDCLAGFKGTGKQLEKCCKEEEEFAPKRPL